jgi:hypothetical protein
VKYALVPAKALSPGDRFFKKNGQVEFLVINPKSLKYLVAGFEPDPDTVYAVNFSGSLDTRRADQLVHPLDEHGNPLPPLDLAIRRLKGSEHIWRERREAQQAAANDRGAAAEVVRQLLGLQLGIPPHYLLGVEGGWDCPESPLGHCLYNRLEDPASDYCLFCGGPEERK